MTFIEGSWQDYPGMSMTAGNHDWTEFLVEEIRHYPDIAALLPPGLVHPKLYFLLYHLTKLETRPESVIEVGAGYGWFAQNYLALTPSASYTIIDLPWRLGDLSAAVPSAHLVDVSSGLDMKNVGSCELFVSTWALCEGTKEFVDFVVDRHFFGAEHLLLAFRVCPTPGLPDADYLYSKLLKLGYDMEVVPWDLDSRYVVT